MSTESSGQEWFEIVPLGSSTWAIGEPRQEQRVYSFLIAGRDAALLIDTGTGAADILQTVRLLTDRPIMLVNSHTHWDHIGNNWRFDQIAVHEREADRLASGVPNSRLRKDFRPEAISGSLPAGFDPLTFAIPASSATSTLSGDETFDLGGRVLKAQYVGGHSPGLIALIDEANGALFSTDFAYPGALYAFGSDTDWDQYRTAMAELAAISASFATIHGSHDDPLMPPSMLKSMSAAFDQIEQGRPAESDDGRIARYEFDGFAVLRDSPPGETRGDA